MQLRDPVNAGLTRWRLTVLAPSRKAGRMSELTRDDTAEPVSRDQNSQARTGTGKNNFPCSAEDWQPHPVDPYFADSTNHTHSAIEYVMTTVYSIHTSESARLSYPQQYNTTTVSTALVRHDILILNTILNSDKHVPCVIAVIAVKTSWKIKLLDIRRRRVKKKSECI